MAWSERRRMNGNDHLALAPRRMVTSMLALGAVAAVFLVVGVVSAQAAALLLRQEVELRRRLVALQFARSGVQVLVRLSSGPVGGAGALFTAPGSPLLGLDASELARQGISHSEEPFPHLLRTMRLRPVGAEAPNLYTLTVEATWQETGEQELLETQVFLPPTAGRGGT